MTLTGQQIIGNSNSKLGNSTFAALNPANGQNLDTTFYEATTDEVDKAVQLAAKAAPLYSKKTPVEKATFLERIAEEIINLGDALIQRCMAETGLPEARLTGERS